AAAQERVFEVQLVQAPQQGQRFRTLRPRRVVVAGAGQSQQGALAPDGEFGVVRIDPSALVLNRASRLFF
ncbi:MAG: hypothetical protein RMJ82_15195, partial [Gemmatales bacterium]|nr:hypothetical protein [Gemmatales bacterium]